MRPSAIRFAEDGGPVLVGFGRQSETDPSTTTRAAEPWAHVAPETRRSGRCELPGEIYALTATLYTLIAGRHQADLFYAEAYDGMMAAIPNPLRQVIYGGCAYNPAERPRDVESFRSLLASRLEGIGSPTIGDAPWRPEPMPEQPPDFIVPDGHLQAVLSALRGAAAPPLASRRTPEISRSSEMEDSAPTLATGGGALDYTMPVLHRKDPGFRDPFEPVDPGDLPAYVDPRAQGGMVPSPPQRFTVRDVGATPATPPPAPSRGVMHRAVPLLSGLVGVLAVVATTMMIGVSIFAWLATAQMRADAELVRRVRSEKTLVEHLASTNPDRQAVEEAWFAFEQRPTAENAAAFARVVQKSDRGETTPADTRATVKRLHAALSAWERATRAEPLP
ncbi:MAG: hypothetical protein R3F59_11025 [Myxococcota bacterium]